MCSRTFAMALGCHSHHWIILSIANVDGAEVRPLPHTDFVMQLAATLDVELTVLRPEAKTWSDTNQIQQVESSSSARGGTPALDLSKKPSTAESEQWTRPANALRQRMLAPPTP